MKKSFYSVALALLAAIAICVPRATRAADDDAITAVLAADQARAVALLAADTNALVVILADDLRYTHSDGKVETKSTHIAAIMRGLRYTQFKTSNVTAHVITPDVVVLNGIIDQRKGEKAKDSRLMFQAVWRKKSGLWQLTSLQTAAPLAPAR